jgi:hypothetical protein
MGRGPDCAGRHARPLLPLRSSAAARLRAAGKAPAVGLVDVSEGLPPLAVIVLAFPNDDNPAARPIPPVGDDEQ